MPACTCEPYSNNLGQAAFHDVVLNSREVVSARGKRLACSCLETCIPKLGWRAALEDRQLATGGHDGRLSLWDLQRPEQPLASMCAHSGIVNAIDGAGSKVLLLSLPPSKELTCSELCPTKGAGVDAKRGGGTLSILTLHNAHVL